MKPYNHYITGFSRNVAILIIGGCAATIPSQLTDARAAYARASQGPAATEAPAELRQALVSLNAAEQSFTNDSDSERTRTLAYVARRKAEVAQAVAANKLASERKQGATTAYEQTQVQQAHDAKVVLAKTQAELVASQQREKDATIALAKLAAVKEEQRGLVITLSGSVLFASDRSALLPAAQHRLDQVTAALMTTKERHLTVEGHTDSQGSAEHNQVLSQDRADAVRNYIVSRGYPAQLVQSHGIGKDRPIASNTSSEGRANNRRVEIIVTPLLASTQLITTHGE